MFVTLKKNNFNTLQSVADFLVMISESKYVCQFKSEPFQNLSSDFVSKILKKENLIPAQMQQSEGHKRSVWSKIDQVPRPILVLGAKKTVYVSCQGSSIIQ